MSDVFVSYTSIDREWAKRIDALLRKALPGATTFVDHEALRAGDDWENKLEEAVRKCRHMVVLWSDAARENSTWVQREIWSFRAESQHANDPGRRLVCINLQGRNDSTKRLQQIEIPEVQQAYPDPDKVPAAAWTQLGRMIEDGLDPNRQRLPVPLVVLSLTQQQLKELTADRWKWLRDDFQIPDADLLGRYGATYEDWLPFAKPQNVAAVLEEVRGQVNDVFDQYRVFWKFPPPTFWQDTDVAQAFFEQEFNTSQLSVLVIDPVAISHPDVFQRLMIFQDCLYDSRVVIITLPPFGVQPELLRLRAALMKRGKPYFNDFFKPPVAANARRLAAQCTWHVSGADDVARYILAAANFEDEQHSPTPRSAYVRNGQRR